MWKISKKKNYVGLNHKKKGIKKPPQKSSMPTRQLVFNDFNKLKTYFIIYVLLNKKIT